jgi:hypothetical protein
MMLTLLTPPPLGAIPVARGAAREEFGVVREPELGSWLVPYIISKTTLEQLA